MKFITEEIRTIAVKAYLEKQATRQQLADIFGYTPATISNWIRAYKREDRLARLPNGHRKSCFSPEELEQLTDLLEKNVDMTLAEIKEHFNKTCSLVAIHKIVKKLGFVFKKKL